MRTQANIQLCDLCDEPTGRCAEDQLTILDRSGSECVVCEDCYDRADEGQKL